MKSLYTYIVEPLHGKLYNNVKKFEGGELITSSSIENHTTTKTIDERVDIIEKLITPVIPGATIIVHHNVFRKYNDMKGVEQYAAGLIKDKMYMVDPYQVFMYKNPKDNKWTTLDPYCFISPMDNDIDFHNGSEKEMYGIMEYPNTYMKKLGLSKGDLIAFKTDSEYEFNIEGKKYYRVNSNNICLTK